MMLLTISTFAQKSFFSDISKTAIRATTGKHDLDPEKYRSISLDVNGMKDFLWALPLEKNIIYNRNNTPVLALPMPDGTIGRFHVWESSIQEKGLEDKFPEIKTFAGQGIDDPYATIRFDYSPYLGFHAQILSAVTGRIYIDPYARGNINNYMSYLHSDNKRDARFECRTPDPTDLPGIENIEAGPCRGTNLTTYRLAVTVTGEYAQTLSGVTVGGATPGLPGPTHAGVVASANRVSGLYEQDLAIRLVLVANNNLIEFLNPSTDPFANDGNSDLNIITSVINGLVGAANYDIGHQFCTNESGGVGAGVAFLGVVCTGNKGGGLTGRSNPTGDGYDIDYVAHEMGHQFGAQHTFNSNSCASSGGSFEPGGGTTIMAYAGICAATENIQPNSDAVFHAKSFDDISTFLATGSGGTCGVITPTGNTLPIITSTPNNGISIPINTPFVLTATATDADGDALTYNWEGWDAGAAGSWTSAATSTTRALFRTRVSKTTGTRTFPDIRVIAANYPGTAAPSAMDGLRGETLPQVARAMKFRLAVRDNRAGGGGNVSAGQGCQDATTFQINAVGTTPFAVTVPNGGESYFASSTQTVTWNNAATTAAPFNVANVKITYSSDGGLTYPITLLASTANDGSEPVIMPSSTNTTSRIRIEAIGNIFFDISNANFTLTPPPTDFNFGTITAGTAATCPAAATIVGNIATTQTGGFSNTITLAATAGVPAGTTISFGTNPVAPGSSSTITLNGANTLAAGSYSVTVTGTATGASVKTTTVVFNVPVGAAPVLTTNSVAATVCAPSQATFSVVSSTAGVTYQWQSATTLAGTYSNISGATAASYTTAATTAAMNGMGYRCVVSTQCGTVTSANALLTVNTVAAITTQPTAQAACTGTGATFTVAATGTGVSYQWQSSPTGLAGSWTNVGSNIPSYTILSVTAGMNTFYQVIVSTVTCPATVTSNTAVLTITASVGVTTNPVSVSACVGATANFAVVATGAGLTYQWQSAPSSSGTFTNVTTGTGGTTASYTTAPATVGMNGSVYRVNVTGTCNSQSSTVATLTVNTAAAVASDPTDVTICSGITASFTGSGTGTGATYQWQSSNNATTGFVNVVGGTGATTGTYTTPITLPAAPVIYYRLAIITTTCAGTVYTAAAKLTVNTNAIINTQPTLPVAVCVTSTNVLTVNASFATSYQWQVSTTAVPAFTNIPLATTASYTIALPTVAMNGNKYRVQVFSSCTPGVATNSNEVTLNVTPPVAITQAPIATSGCVFDARTFNVVATGATNYQWQVATSATGPWTNTNAADTFPALSIVNPSLSMSGNFYRVIVSSVNSLGTCSSITTDGAKLLLSVKPVVVLTQAATSNVNAATNSKLTTTVSPISNYTYNWKRNGATIANTLASTFISLNVDDAATYVVTVTEPTTGCTSDATNDATKTTSALTSDNLLNDRVFIYPNPVSSIMYVRFNTSTSATRGTMLNVYDEKGARIISKAYDITSTNGRMAVDMSGQALGTYLVYIMDAAGNKLGVGKVVKVQ
jgi:hypothetical protein